jgi:uncharacterized protein YjbI with pentapeptide repeats
VPINSIEGMGGLQLDAGGIDFSNRYFRSADLRGVDFSTSRLEGVSLNRAKISGASLHGGNRPFHPIPHADALSTVAHPTANQWGALLVHLPS